MSDKIEFTSNYSDHSTERGFQFEFNCDRCGTGYRTRFQPFAAGTISSALDTASNLFGGIFNSAANVGEQVRSAAWQKAWDNAFVEAVEELKPDFVQCPRCSTWVCRKSCWNTQRGLCKECAPDMGVEMAAAQASRTVEEVWAHSKMAEEDREMLKEESWREGVRATCPKCNAPLADNAKFCAECGAPIKKEKFCSKCGSKIKPDAKFCPDCGEKQ
jgi:membrane protease subunit (stomatin/prohibitin family)